MCGSPAEIDGTGVGECYGYDWQTQYIECTKTLDPHCGMELSLHMDMGFSRTNICQALITLWDSIDGTP